MADDDKPIDLSDERSRREPPTKLQRDLAALEGLRRGDPRTADTSRASEYVSGVDVGEKAAEQRFQLAMEKAQVDFSVRIKIQAAYDALKNKRA